MNAFTVETISRTFATFSRQHFPQSGSLSSRRNLALFVDLLADNEKSRHRSQENEESTENTTRSALLRLFQRRFLRVGFGYGEFQSPFPALGANVRVRRRTDKVHFALQNGLVTARLQSAATQKCPDCAPLGGVENHRSGIRPNCGIISLASAI